MALKRKRSIGILTDITNATPIITTKRFCAEKANSQISAMVTQNSRPRTQKPEATIDNSTASMHTCMEDDPATLYQMIKTRPHVLKQGMESIKQYLERNTKFAIQKAIALHVFAVAVSDGSGIIESCKQASRITGYQSEVIRRWAVACFRDFFGGISNIDDITDEILTSEFSSDQGRHSKVRGSLVENEDFKVDAQTYVHENGYVKGKPNLTALKFALWVKEEWGIDVCEETARSWLHKLGFSYKQFSKGLMSKNMSTSKMRRVRQIPRITSQQLQSSKGSLMPVFPCFKFLCELNPIVLLPC